MSETILEGERCRLRPYRDADAAALPEVANDPMVARWLNARFPHPYTHADAVTWVAFAKAQLGQINFAIEVDGRLAGSVGYTPGSGETAGTAEFGYWLGRAFWGKGIATDAARTAADHAFARGLRRLQAMVFAPNAGSVRVLEKAGFELEGRLRDYYITREGVACDGLLYARLAQGLRKAFASP